MHKDNFNRVFDLYLDTTITSLRKYENNGINIYEFDHDDIENICDKNIINNIPSIYILENTKDNSIYVGETENFKNRINNHAKNKNFDKIYVINSSNLNKNLCLAIEEKTISVLKNSVSDYKILNSNEKNNGFISKADNIRLKKFWTDFEEIYFLLKFNLSPKKNDLNEQKLIEENKKEVFIYENSKLIIADGGYLLLEGSKIFMGAHSLPQYSVTARKMRDNLKKENNIADDDCVKVNVFSRYPSPLGALVTGRPVNGYDIFKTKEGVKLGDYLGRTL